MPPRSSRSQVFIDLDSDDGEECKSKRPRTSTRETMKTSGSSKNVLPSCGDDLLPKRRSKRIANSRRDKMNTNKLDTDIFELYMDVLWKRIDEDKKSSYAYFDSLWFNMYNSGNNKSTVLKWIKAKKIFSRQYVFVPIVCWGHWNLLVLCNFGEANHSDKKKPRMLLLDSLKTTNPIKLQSAIKRLIVDILKTEERQDSEQFINKVHLEFPEVPQQTGDDCGIYVLFFIYCFLQNEKLGEDFRQLSKDVMFNSEELEKFQKDIDSFRMNRNTPPSCKTSCGDDHLSKRSSKRIANSRRNMSKDKLDTDSFELYMEVVWKGINEDKKSAYAYFDSLWFNMYSSGNNIANVLKWIKAKKIFSRQFVFVPIVCWGHWNLLVLCNFGETNYSDTKKKPRMLLLDSLKTSDLVNLQSTIQRLIVDILKTEERQDIEQFVNKVHLEFPEVPQQTGDESGIYVLFFIYCFLQNEKLGEDFSQLAKDIMFNSDELEKFLKDIDSFQVNTEVAD